MYLTKFSTPWGRAGISWTEIGVNGLFFMGNVFCSECFSIVKTDPFDTVVQLRYFFKRKLQVFDVPIDLNGTSFQKKVWLTLQQIPYGQTWSYQQLASAIGLPQAARPVGNANGANPIPMIIPCHRVIHADGSISGYSQGLEIKKALLSLEKATKSYD